MLEIKNLKLTLEGISVNIPYLRVEHGDYFAIMGMTGAGKTVLIETIAGFHKHKGEIYLDGKRIDNLPPNRRNIALVYQDFMLFPHLTVRENIEYGLRLRKVNDLRIVDEIADRLEIKELMERYPSTLSGGEKQRVAIARALVIKPKILLMDEPFSSLDVKTKENIRKLVRNVVREYDTTVVHVTHDFEDVFILANKVMIMKDGKVLQIGTPDDVFSRPSSEFTASFVSANILRCKSEGYNKNMSTLNCGGVTLYSTDLARGSVILSIRPEEIIISPTKILSSARNVLSGKVLNIEQRGNLVWITVDVGVKIKVVITPNSLEAMHIKKNDKVFVIFKASSVKVIG